MNLAECVTNLNQTQDSSTSAAQAHKLALDNKTQQMEEMRKRIRELQQLLSDFQSHQQILADTNTAHLEEAKQLKALLDTARQQRHDALAHVANLRRQLTGVTDLSVEVASTVNETGVTTSVP